MYGIVYHKDYNKYNLGENHPLIGDKPEKTIKFFKEKGILKEVDLLTAKKATMKDLLRVHNPRYIERIKYLSKTGGRLSLDTPAPRGIYDIARLAVGGTILGGDKLFNGYQCMCNPLAGFHHASRSYASGFCFFNDEAIVVEFLREKYGLDRFLIIDLDVHHANGMQEIYYDDPSVLLVSFHQDGRTLYPGTGFIDEIGRGSGEGYTVNLPLPPGTGSKSYLNAFYSIIPGLAEQFQPEVIVYQCGVDTHHSDPLADLRLVYQTYYHLGRSIMDLSRKTCNKLLVLFGGGYNSESCVKSYYNIMCGLLGRSDYLEEKKEIFDDKVDYVDGLIMEVKKLLEPYWEL